MKGCDIVLFLINKFDFVCVFKANFKITELQEYYVIWKLAKGRCKDGIVVRTEPGLQWPNRQWCVLCVQCTHFIMSLKCLV